MKILASLEAPFLFGFGPGVKGSILVKKTSTFKLNALISRVVGLIDRFFMIFPGPNLSSFEILYSRGEVRFIEGLGHVLIY